MPVPDAFSTQADGFVEASVAGPTEVLLALTGWAMSHGVGLDGLEVLRPSLEDVYLELTEST